MKIEGENEDEDEDDSPSIRVSSVSIRGSTPFSGQAHVLLPPKKIVLASRRRCRILRACLNAACADVHVRLRKDS
jgi:hypothetical protein